MHLWPIKTNSLIVSRSWSGATLLQQTLGMKRIKLTVGQHYFLNACNGKVNRTTEKVRKGIITLSLSWAGIYHELNFCHLP